MLVCIAVFIKEVEWWCVLVFSLKKLSVGVLLFSSKKLIVVCIDVFIEEVECWCVLLFSSKKLIVVCIDVFIEEVDCGVY